MELRFDITEGLDLGKQAESATSDDQMHVLNRRLSLASHLSRTDPRDFEGATSTLLPLKKKNNFFC